MVEDLPLSRSRTAQMSVGAASWRQALTRYSFSSSGGIWGYLLGVCLTIRALDPPCSPICPPAHTEVLLMCFC